MPGDARQTGRRRLPPMLIQEIGSSEQIERPMPPSFVGETLIASCRRGRAGIVLLLRARSCNGANQAQQIARRCVGKLNLFVRRSKKMLQPISVSERKSSGRDPSRHAPYGRVQRLIHGRQLQLRSV